MSSVNIIGFNKTTATKPAGPEKRLYRFELRNQVVEEAFGLLSYGHVFVSVVQDEHTPVLSIPYDRIEAIKIVPPVELDNA